MMMTENQEHIFESAFFPPLPSNSNKVEEEKVMISPRQKPCIEPHPRPSKPILSRALRFSGIPKPKIFYSKNHKTPQKKEKKRVLIMNTTPVKKVLAKPTRQEIINVREDLKRSALIRFPSSRVSLWSRQRTGSETFKVSGMDPQDIILKKELLTEMFAEYSSQDRRMNYVLFESDRVASRLSETKTNCSIYFDSEGVLSESVLATPRREMKAMYEDVLNRKYVMKPCDSFDAISCVVSVLPHRILAVRLDCLVPKASFDLVQLDPMPLFDCPLSRALQNGAGVGTGQYGYMTMTASRRIVPILPGDRTRMSMPLVGMWTVNRSLLWKLCTHFAHFRGDSCTFQRASTQESEGSFLVGVFDRVEKFHVYECNNNSIKNTKVSHYEWTGQLQLDEIHQQSVDPKCSFRVVTDSAQIERFVDVACEFSSEDVCCVSEEDGIDDVDDDVDLEKEVVVQQQHYSGKTV